MSSPGPNPPPSAPLGPPPRPTRRDEAPASGPPPGMPSGPPPGIQVAFLLWVAAVVLGLASVLLGLSRMDELRADALARAGATGVDGRTAETLARLLAVGTVALGMLFAGSLLLFAIFLLRGRNWARIVLAVLGAVSVLTTAVGLVGPATVDGLTGVLDVAQAVLITAAVVLMFLSAANGYFRRVRSWS